MIIEYLCGRSLVRGVERMIRCFYYNMDCPGTIDCPGAEACPFKPISTTQ